VRPRFSARYLDASGGGFEVYLHADEAVRVRRIVQREGGDPATVAAFTRERDRQDRDRYLKLYGIDNNDYSAADLVIDTALYDPEEIADQISEELEKKRGPRSDAR